jgi:hypothetical protein
MSDTELMGLFKEVKKIALSGSRKTDVVRCLKVAFKKHYVSK